MVIRQSESNMSSELSTSTRSLPGNELQTQAAALSEEAMEKILAKEFARAMGNNAVYLYSRLSKEWNRIE